VRLNLKIWRQAGPTVAGKLVDYAADHVSPDMSFLEMLDVVNEGLVKQGQETIAFDSDCREGICGMCSLVVNGIPHGPDRGTTVCQLHMRRFKDGDTITIEPWRARAFPVVKDLVVDRSAFDRVIAATRRARSGLPWGSIASCEIFALMKRCADAFLHAATQAPQPMHAAESMARSEISFEIGIALPSGAPPQFTDT